MISPLALAPLLGLILPLVKHRSTSWTAMMICFDSWLTLGIAEIDLIKALRIHRWLFQLRVRPAHGTRHIICIIVGPHHKSGVYYAFVLVLMNLLLGTVIGGARALLNLQMAFLGRSSDMMLKYMQLQLFRFEHDWEEMPKGSEGLQRAPKGSKGK